MGRTIRQSPLMAAISLGSACVCRGVLVSIYVRALVLHPHADTLAL